MSSNFSDTDVLILCGGLGTRLQSVLPDRPKGLAPMDEVSLLDILINDLLLQGLSRFILCVGYLKEQIVEYFHNYPQGEFLFSEEENPLGTMHIGFRIQALLMQIP